VIEHVEVQVLVLLLIASLVGMVARRLRVPYTLALVVAGLGLSFIRLGVLADVELTPQLLLLLFLPPLLFEAAYHLPFRDLRRNAVHIGFLAIVGVMVAVALTAVLSYGGLRGLGLGRGFGWPQALLFASVIAATDPISVLALFKQIGAPRRLYQVVEGESLINDGVAVVVFAIIAGVLGVPLGHTAPVALHGGREIAVYAIVSFARTGVGGLLVGAMVGATASVLTRQIDDHLIEITLTTVVAWGSFLLAEQLGVSGVLSTVSAGVLTGSFGKEYGMSPSTRMAVRDFWEYMGFVSNSFIFLLIGLKLEPWTLAADAAAVGVAFLAVVLARAVLIYGGVPLADRLATPLPPKWRHVLAWGGLRGSLSMVLILGLPPSFPGQALLLKLVFGVVAVSLFVQGLTMAPLMRRLGILGGAGLALGRPYERARGQAIAFRHVVLEADELAQQGLLDEATHRSLTAWYQRERRRAAAKARQLAGETARPEHLLEAAKTLATIEREAIGQAVAAGVICAASGAELSGDIDVRLDKLDRAAHEGEAELMVAFRALYDLIEEGAPAGGTPKGDTEGTPKGDTEG